MTRRIFYRKALHKTPAEGSLTELQVGDLVTYRDANSRVVHSLVETVNIKEGTLRVAPLIYNGEMLRPGCALEFPAIERASRKTDGSEEPEPE
jgi:hypothetical protein